ncbi:histidine--tRNA ligase [Candidatus Nomurabacteria bacterium]|nr:histidine--tRNA ligase [Candidatus Nomurabacteria bacterium]
MSTEKKRNNKEPLVSVKGMRDILDEQYYHFQGFFEKAQEIAVYYGFKPIDTPIVENEEVFTSSIGEGTDIIDKEMYTLKTKGGDHLALRPEHTAGLMRSYIEHGMQALPQPLLFYNYGPVFRHDKPQKGRYRQFWQFDMDVLGSDKSILDALVIKTAWTILQEAGAPNLSIDINSIGDKVCRASYIRELVSYYKKNINILPAIDRERLKVNPLRILDSKEEKTIELNRNAPDCLSHLCVDCKKHFKEVLEYLEQMDIPYTINKCLVRGLSYYTRTVFEIMIPAEEEVLTDQSPRMITIASGGRYDYLARSLGSKKDVSAVGSSIGVDRVVEAPWFAKLSPRVIKKAKIYFIQLGFDAKLKSLNVIEILRKGKVPIAQSISKDNLGAQLAVAEKLGMRYVIIFGQKEALENSVIFRDMNTRCQETVKLPKLLEYIKELK